MARETCGRSSRRESSRRTEVSGVLDEAVHHGRLQLEPLLHVGVHLVRSVSGVKEVRRQHDGQVAAVHLVLATPEISHKQMQLMERKTKLSREN